MNVNDLEKNVYFVNMLTVIAFATMFLTTNLILAAILSFLGFFCVGVVIGLFVQNILLKR